MISCKVDFNRLYEGGKIAKLYCAGVGVFPVFSGLGSLLNRQGCSDLKNGAISPGRYWIVDRPTGGLNSWIVKMRKEWKSGNDYDSWFALYRQDSLVDDWTFIGTRERGNFRLHPLRPDGTGVSDGCITFYNHTDFNVLRDYLLRAHTMIIPVLGQKAYGEIEVLGDINAPCLHF